MADPRRVSAARLAWRHAARAAGDAWLLLAALVVAVAAVTAVTQMTARVQSAMLQQGASTLAADLRLSLRAPLDEQRAARIAPADVRTAAVTTFSSVVTGGDTIQRVAVKAVESGYPLRGALTLRRGAPGTPSFQRSHAPPAGTVWVGQPVLDRLGLSIGDSLAIGEVDLTIGAVLMIEPDRGPGLGNIAPRVMMSAQDIAATGLLGPGSRAHYALLFAGPAAAIQRLRQRLEPTLAVGQRLETPAQANRALRRALARSGRFLDLAALVAVILAAIAIALTARRHAQARLDEIALFKTLGAARGLIARMMAWQLLGVGVLGISGGLAVGTLAQYAICRVLASAFDIALPGPPLATFWPGPVIGMILLAGFAWPALASARRTPPARILARSLSGAPAGELTSYAAAVVSVIVLAGAATRDITLTAWVVGGAAAGTLVLAGGALALLWALDGVRSRVAARAGPGVRLGLAAPLRRRGASVVQIVAFGVGLIMLFTLVIVRGDLLAGWRADIAADAPNRFLVNITPQQQPKVASFLAARGIRALDFYPIVRARLVSVAGQSIDDNDVLAESAGELARRALNLSWAASLKADNRLTAGQWWQASDYGKPLASIDESVAERLKIGVGDRLGFDIAGQTLRLRVASIRAIDWSSLQANFYVLTPPNVLDEYPTRYITSFYLPATRHAVLAALVRAFANISVVDIDAILSQLKTLIDRVSLAVELVFVFTLAAGLIVLLAAVQANRADRRREAALLRALGARARWLRQATLIEYLLIGGCASVLAAVVAQSSAIVLATQVFDLDYAWRWPIWLAAITGATIAIAAAGTAALGDILRQPAWTSLRSEE